MDCDGESIDCGIGGLCLAGFTRAFVYFVGGYLASSDGWARCWDCLVGIWDFDFADGYLAGF